MIQRIVPCAVGLPAVGKRAGVRISFPEKNPEMMKNTCTRQKMAGGNGGAEMEKGDDIREYQLQYVNGIDAFFGISSQIQIISSLSVFMKYQWRKIPAAFTAAGRIIIASPP